MVLQYHGMVLQYHGMVLQYHGCRRGTHTCAYGWRSACVTSVWPTLLELQLNVLTVTEQSTRILLGLCIYWI